MRRGGNAFKMYVTHMESDYMNASVFSSYVQQLELDFHLIP